MAAPLQAGEWRITPRLTVQEDYSDNINLAPEGQEKSDFVTEVNPGVAIRGEGSRVNLNLDYTLQTLFYRRDEHDDAVNHQLQASADAEVIDQIFFLDAQASASQQNRDNRGRVTTSNISISDNREDVYTFALTPTFRHHFGKYADTVVRAPYDWVESGGDDDASTSFGTEASLVSGRFFAKTPWSINYTERTIDNVGGGDDTTFKSLTATLSYVFSRRYRVFFTWGRDENDTDNQDLEDSGAVRRVGLDWTPSPRTSFSGGYEVRPLGDSAFFDFQHRRRRSVWSASLSQSAVTSRDLQLQRVLIPLEDPFGEPIETPGGEIVLVPVDTIRQSTDVIVTRDFDASVALRGRRTNYDTGIRWSEREAEGNDDETLLAWTFGIQHSLSRDLDARLSGSWQETEFDQSGETDEIWTLALALSYDLAKDATGNVTLRRVDSDTGDGVDSYKENRITAGVTIRF